MLLIAVLNGILREAVFRKFLDTLPAHQLSTITLFTWFAFYIRYIMYRFPPASDAQALMTGLMWLFLTLAFEFGFGRYRGNTWQTLLADYNLLQGRLWIFIPLWIAIAPYLFYRVFHR